MPERVREQVVELRIHGVGGSDTEEMLGAGAVPLSAEADENSGFWKSVQPDLTAGVPHDRKPDEWRAFLWGTHDPWRLGLWLVLLPFTLVNAAGWAVAPASAPGAAMRSGSPNRWQRVDGWRRATAAAWSRRLIALIGLSLTVAWTLWMVAIIGDTVTFTGVHRFHLHVGPGITIASGLGLAALAATAAVVRSGKPGRWIWVVILVGLGLAVLGNSLHGGRLRTTLSLAAAGVTASGPFVLAGVNRKSFEKYRPRLGGTGIARERRRLRDEETLASPCFFDHPTESVGLLFLHGAVGVVILGILAERGWAAGGLHPKEGGFLGRGFLVLGATQFALMVALLAMAVLGTSRDRADRPRSVTNAAVNALRAPSMATIGVFMFTAVLGCIDAALRFDGVRFRVHPELELISGFVTGAALATAVTLVVIALRFVRGLPVRTGAIAPSAWRSDLTLQWVVERLDLAAATAGVAISVVIIASIAAHRSSGGAASLWALQPRGESFAWWEWSHHALPVLGWLCLPLPGLMVLATWWQERDGRRGSPLRSLWDVLGFWPRRFHPLGVPPEAERTVPELQSHLLQLVVDQHERALVVGHSQGSVIAYAALLALRDRGAVARIDLMTVGSPLFVLYPRMFPGQVIPEQIEELGVELHESGHTWLNVARDTDFFGIRPDPARVPKAADGRPIIDHRTAATSATLDMVDDQGNRQESEHVALLAHSHYFHARDVEDMAHEAVGRLRRRTIEPHAAPVPSFAPRRRMVSWFDPRLLALTAYQAAVSAVFGRWADARKVEAIGARAEGVALSNIDLRPDPGEVWIDYVADEGDAFAPTFLVARALAQPALGVDGVADPLPRGRLLVLGGDEVYPVASRERYENQLVGPYALASACVDDWASPSAMVALPGNHDWYDGLQSFDETFCTGRALGGWETVQDRSYWAVRLTCPEQNSDDPTWWLWGVDLQLDNRFDHLQAEYFGKQALRLGDNDFVILCSPIPTWAHSGGDPMAFDALMDLVRDTVDGRGVRFVLHISGDSHHYARYERGAVVQTKPRQDPSTKGEGDENEDNQLSENLAAGRRLPVQYVTCGGGGAFTHPTHDLVQTIDLPVAYDVEAPTLRLRARRPQASKIEVPSPVGTPVRGNPSRRLILSALWLFISRNPAFVPIPAAAAALATLAWHGRAMTLVGASPTVGDFASWWVQAWGPLLVSLLVLGAWVLFAKPARGGSKLAARAVGFVHGWVQAAAMFLAGWAAVRMSPPVTRWVSARLLDTFSGAKMPMVLDRAVGRVSFGVVTAALGAVGACLVLSLYLWLSNRGLGMHDNESASAVASTRYKHFMRIRIRGAEATCWVLGVRPSPNVLLPFESHDPRPRPTAAPVVALWDCFRVGVSSGPGAI